MLSCVIVREEASGIQSRQMVGKQISWQTSPGNSPVFRRQICPPCLIPSRAALLQAERCSKWKWILIWEVLVSNLISGYSPSAASPCWGFESKHRKGTFSEAEIKCPSSEVPVLDACAPARQGGCHYVECPPCARHLACLICSFQSHLGKSSF